jgi:organic hydroperoxide reductase OsmC/OhrA
MKQHQYTATIKWTGNKGTGTNDYRAYERSHTISMEGKPDILGSSDASFRGEKSKHNPEDLLLASLSGCHMLWYLHLCADHGVVVTSYTDNATAIMTENTNGGGQFTEATLHPQVIVTDPSMIDQANALHEEAHRLCFIARSVNFPVRHYPTTTSES